MQTIAQSRKGVAQFMAQNGEELTLAPIGFSHLSFGPLSSGHVAQIGGQSLRRRIGPHLDPTLVEWRDCLEGH